MIQFKRIFHEITIIFNFKAGTRFGNSDCMMYVKNRQLV